MKIFMNISMTSKMVIVAAHLHIDDALILYSIYIYKYASK